MCKQTRACPVHLETTNHNDEQGQSFHKKVMTSLPRISVFDLSGRGQARIVVGVWCGMANAAFSGADLNVGASQLQLRFWRPALNKAIKPWAIAPQGAGMLAIWY
jgi:hypothetical protein